MVARKGIRALPRACLRSLHPIDTKALIP